MTDIRHLESPRLLLRPISANDFEPFYARLVCDPIVMTFFHAYTRPMPEAERREKARRDFFDHFADGAERFGYICWAITAKHTISVSGGQSSTECGAGELLGWAGIVTPALNDAALGPELAYMIASRLHGQGFITEAAAMVVRDAFTRYQLSALHAVMDAPNTASRRVAEKLGFTYQGKTTVYGSEDMVLYTLSKHAALK